MKKILGSIGVLAFVGALAWGATGAFFTDTEISQGNTFTAGAIDLQVDSTQNYNGNTCVGGEWSGSSSYPVPGTSCGGSWTLKNLNPTLDKFFDFGDIKPGDEGENTISLHVINNDAYVCAAVTNLTDFENGQTEPEALVDNTAGVNEGELSQTMVWKVWRDDGTGGGTPGDNIQNGSEPTLATGNPTNGTLAIYDSSTGGALLAGDTAYLGVSWSLPAQSGNETQTDSMTGDISFSVVQSRNNDGFLCSQSEIPSEPIVINQDDLALSSQDLQSDPSSWFFYNDTNDTIMTIDQFSGSGGQNHMDSVDGVEGAKMVLDNGTELPAYTGKIGEPRYNIATYKYGGTKLSDITTLSYRIYDASISSQTPFLNFNIDFFNTNVWQKRLVQVPTGVTPNTWTTVDALAGSWTYSGTSWPDGVISDGTIPGGTSRTWADIVADYPDAKIYSNDPWFGIRVGHPGPISETSYVDWVNFNGEVNDFKI